MPIPILMPALSPTMTEGNIAKWIKKEGEKIVPGDIIAEVETDKATMEVEAIDEGVLSKILFKDGTENVEVNKLIGIILQEGEKEEDLENFLSKHSSSKRQVKSEGKQDSNNELLSKNIQQETSTIPEETQQDENVFEEKKNSNIDNIYNNSKVNIENEELKEKKLKNDTRLLVSPLAKRIADLKNINLHEIKGTGPNGRIVKKDLDIYLKSGFNKDNLDAELNTSEKVGLTNIKKTIGKRLQLSKQNIPHFYIKSTIDIDKIENARKAINNAKEENNHLDNKISLNDLLIKALALALEKVPEMNATWNEDSIIYYQNVDISVAVATKDGLFTPVIRSACKKRISEISYDMKKFIEKAKDNKLLPEEYNGGSFSISNLGMYNIDEFSAIINPPQTGILAVGSIKHELRKKDNEIITVKTITFTLSVDHRIADGAIAAKLMNNLKFILSNPISMII